MSNISTFKFENHPIRTVTKENQLWFVAQDICDNLKIQNVTQALQKLDEDERSMFNIGRQGNVNIVNESGMYTLILRSRDAVTKGSTSHRFRKWVTNEVLPSIRQNGSYSLTINTEQQHLIRKAVDERVHRTGEHHQSVYSRLYNAFKIPSYKDLPASKFNDAIEFLGGVATKNSLSDDDWYSLAWLYKAADKMRFTCSCIESALRELGSSHAGAFYSMTHDYNHTLKEAKEIIAKGTAHIKPRGIDDNWNNVLPIIRHDKPRSRIINFAADIPYLD